jgi:hypothetical protein
MGGTAGDWPKFQQMSLSQAFCPFIFSFASMGIQGQDLTLQICTLFQAI